MIALSMPVYTRYASRLPRTPLNRIQWHRASLRHYASDAQAELQWFQELREEMLSRELPPNTEHITKSQGSKLESALSAVLPEGWTEPNITNATFSPPGHHLVYFNPILPSDRLLSDGTDALHSPGGPYVRRMWAGGSLRFDVEKCYNKKSGLKPGFHGIGIEHIKDVQMRGRDDEAKIYVNVERRFAKMDKIVPFTRKQNARPDAFAAAVDQFRRQAQEGQNWGHAMLIEERNLVFMRERTAAELEAFRAGQMAPVRYLEPLGQPDFSHSLTPTPSLLFRYSALTWNAHAIHLDPEYCRNVEGHRNLLVHGPLSLTLMLRLVTGHLQSLPGPLHTITSIEYRNLAPLYCGEEMRLCAREKTSLSMENSRIYDVWVEGPTGGMAVKGTIRTALMPKDPVVSPTSESVKKEAESDDYDRGSSVAGASNVSATPHRRTKLGAFKPGVKRILIARNGSRTASKESSGRDNTTAPSDANTVTLKPILTPSLQRRIRSTHRKRQEDPHNTESIQLAPLEATEPASTSKNIRRVQAPPRPLVPTMSLHTRHLLRRLGIRKFGQPRIDVNLKPVPLHRKYVSEKGGDTIESRFARRGVRRIAIAVMRIRKVTQNLEDSARERQRQREKQGQRQRESWREREGHGKE